ncbi:thiopeptide-type bacteriocin biosynthesis domain-containing protein [Streptomyces sp. TLI_053]|uniref:lantibiotic dehydratase n=1 Tax=Streptomyces sp. TLI_053 TaxID=1855352 RepID=UPI00087A8F14|nr:lantibiotic dehydratase [Streptomyces sp. TLI_053]SDT82700.1 thiopeptide-type bacteriocin biosynthesis domain-containing protein [Streptomyces sp. TLI_053]
MFRAVDGALLRAAVGTPATTPWPDLSSDSAADGAAWSRWITDAWALPGVADAVTVASPPLAAAVEAVAADGVVQERRLRRVGESLVRYLLRMQHRATPFGLFAGVAAVRLGETLALFWGGEHRAIARPDAAWLAAVVERLEEDEALLGQVMVTVDATCVVRGDRLVLPCSQPSGEDAKPLEVAIRRTPPVDAVLTTAQEAVRVEDLVHKVAAEFPDAPPGAVRQLVNQLVRQRVVSTSLRAPMAAPDPLGHLLAQLQAAEVPGTAEDSAAARLLAVHDRLERHNAESPAHSQAVRAEALELMAAIPAAGLPSLAVDLRLDCDLVLPVEVVREAECAAAALARSGPYPQGPPAWRDYHARFLERYGPGAHVPLLELANPDTGLGYPAGYRSSTLIVAPPAVHDRDALLLELAQLAALDGLTTVDVDDVLDQLAPGPVEQTPAHAELCFQLRSESPALLDDGQFTLVVTGVANGAGTLTGRFLHLLDDTDQQRAAGALRRAPSLTAGAVRAQLSSPPLRVRTENVARTPVVLPQSITVAEHGHGTIRLADLTVTADARHMWLFSRAAGRPVEPAILNAVQLTDFTHPLARFLAELPRARAAVLAPFSWGPAASKLPFLPAVRYGRSILAPARWRLDAADLPPAADPWRSWDSALAALRERRRIPAAVDLGDGDRRLRLDLAQRHHRQLLRAHLDRHYRVVLRQAPTSGALGWIDGRAHELVLPLVATQQPVRRPVFAPPAARVERWAPGAAGGGWAYAKIHAHPDRHEELLARLPELTAVLGPLPLWFVRYRDPDPHLRLRIWQSSGAFGDLARHVDTWAAGLAEAGLAGGRVQWDTYWPETGRYGSGQLMRLAEGVFVADSAAVLAQLQHTGPGRAPAPALTAAGMTDIAAGLLGSTDAGMRWLLENVDRRADAALDRDLLRRAVALADPTDTWAALRDTTGTALTEAWARRRAALDAYRRRLIALDGPRPDAVLTSLLHMHHIRAAGIDPDAERTCRRLARAAALTWTTTRTPAGATR